MWVADSTVSRVYAFNMATKQRDVPRDVVIGDDTLRINGLWGDASTSTMYILDNGGKSNSAPKIITWVLPEPPGAPADVAVEPRDSSVGLTWQVPATKGSSEVRSYDIRVSSSDLGGGGGGGRSVRGVRSVAAEDGRGSGGFGGVSGFGTRPSSSLTRGAPVERLAELSTTIDGLENGQEYLIEVRANNEQTFGDWHPRRATPVGPASAPAGLAAVPSAPGELDVGWGEPADDGGRRSPATSSSTARAARLGGPWRRRRWG